MLFDDGLLLVACDGAGAGLGSSNVRLLLWKCTKSAAYSAEVGVLGPSEIGGEGEKKSG